MSSSSLASNLIAGIPGLLASGSFSDITLTCGDSRLKVHKAILCTQSEVFRALLDGKFKEAGASEVDLPDDDPNALQALIYFLYNFNLDFAAHLSNCDASAFLIQVWAIADKYDVAPLRTLVVKHIDKFCDPAKDVDDFVAALRVTDTCTAGNAIWDVLLPKAKTNISLLLQDKAFQELVMEVPALTLSLLGYLDEAKWAEVLGAQVVVQKQKSRAAKKSDPAKASWTEGEW